MDVLTASGPAVPLGIAVAVGVLALALAAALALSWRRPPREASAPAPAPGTYPDDDLPSFREHPPGFPGAQSVPAGGSARAGTAPAGAGRNPVRALTVMALLALLLIAAAAAVAGIAAAADRDAAPARSTAVPAGGLTARGAFGAVILEQRAAGITVTYPRLTVAVSGGTAARAHVLLPTWNCMTDLPPADPQAAGCRAAATEYADLAAPALRIARVGEGLRLHGRFPTYVRPSRGEPVATGRAYELAVTLRPGRPLADGWAAASGELVLAGRRTGSLADGATALRSGG